MNEAGSAPPPSTWAHETAIRNESPVVLPAMWTWNWTGARSRPGAFVRPIGARPSPTSSPGPSDSPSSDVTAMGAAIAGAGNRIRCPLPFALVDRFWDANAAGCPLAGPLRVGVDRYVQPGSRDMTARPRRQRTGWSNLDVGTVWRLYPGSTTQTPTPGTTTLWRWTIPAEMSTATGSGGAPRPNVPSPSGRRSTSNPGGWWARRTRGSGTSLSMATRSGASPNCPVRPGSGASMPVPQGTPAHPSDSHHRTLRECPQQSGRQTVRLVNLAGVFVICNGTLRQGVTPENTGSRTVPPTQPRSGTAEPPTNPASGSAS
jgi:hypothetical protein